MQDKDFDQFIRKAMEDFPAPAYNPADWDNMEDRLHNLNSPQTQPGGNPLRKFGFGKAAMVVSAVVVTAVNAVLFVKSDTNNQETPTKTSIALNQPETTTEDNNTVVITENNATASAVNEVLNQPDSEVNPIHSTQATLTNAGNSTILPEKLPANNAAGKNNKTTTKAGTVAKTNKKTAGSNKSYLAATSGNNNSVWNPGTVWPANTNSISRNNVISGGNQPNTSGNTAAIGCAGNTLPEIAYAIINSDTIYGSRIALSGCQPVSIRFITQDKEADQVSITSNISEMIPGASVVLNKNSQAAFALKLPAALKARQQPYAFTIWLQDNHCPNPTPKAFTFSLSVTPAFTVSVNGITDIEKGQWTMLEAVGAPAGSNFKWSSKGHKESFHTAKISVNPSETVTYAVQVTAPGGCTYTDSVKVNVTNEEPAEVGIKAKYIPNIFTPNGDGSNEYFEVRLPEEGPYSLVILDRWNKRVYSSANYKNNWEAENLPEGTYFYVITTAQEKKTYRGWVEVVR